MLREFRRKIAGFLVVTMLVGQIPPGTDADLVRSSGRQSYALSDALRD